VTATQPDYQQAGPFLRQGGFADFSAPFPSSLSSETRLVISVSPLAFVAGF
jgi:hypothetical protein